MDDKSIDVYAYHYCDEAYDECNDHYDVGEGDDEGDENVKQDQGGVGGKGG